MWYFLTKFIKYKLGFKTCIGHRTVAATWNAVQGKNLLFLWPLGQSKTHNNLPHSTTVVFLQLPQCSVGALVLDNGGIAEL